MIPLELDEIEALCPGRLERAPGRPSRRACRSTPAASARAISSSPSVTARHSSATRWHGRRGGARARRRLHALAALGRAVRDRSEATVVAITGSTGKTSTKDILAAIAAPAKDGRGGGELQQRARRPADALPAGARHRGLHPRARHARPRTDRGARRNRPPFHRRDHEHRTGPSGARRLARSGCRGEGRARGGAAAGRRCDRARRLSSGETTSRSCGAGSPTRRPRTARRDCASPAAMSRSPFAGATTRRMP